MSQKIYKVPEDFAALLAHGTVEFTAARLDGTTFPAELSLAAWETHDRRFFSGFVRDVSERRAAERAQQDALEGEQLLVSNLRELDAAIFSTRFASGSLRSL